MQRYIFIMIIIGSIIISAPVLASNNVHLITLGAEADPEHGDDDAFQIVFIKVPENIKERLYLRIFDPDCGGSLDEKFQNWNTQTRFSLFGGAGAFSSPGLKQPAPDRSKLFVGDKIAEKIFSIDPFTDNKWFTFADFMPNAGENIDGYYYFKLVIQGLNGDDGNLFNIALSLDPKLNQPPEGLYILNYTPALSLPKAGRRFGELRFLIPEDSDELYIRNYDMEKGQLWFETPFDSDYPLNSSGQGEWEETRIQLKPGLKPDLGPDRSFQMGAVILKTSPEHHNNAIILVLDKNQEPIPVLLPILLHRENRRPVPVESVEFLSECLSIVFDGSRSKDRDNNLLEFFWDFGDGNKGKGARVIHKYKHAGSYSCELTVKDDSGRIASQSKKSFSILINEPPIADAGKDQTGAPGQELVFNASSSKDLDGKIGKYIWDFDDGSKAEGINATHTFRSPGLYKVSLRVEDDSKSLCHYGTDSAEIWINASPVVDIGPDLITSPQESVNFDGSNCFDSDGEIKEYLWDFGDGAQGKGVNIDHKYKSPGKYTVTLTVRDNADVENSSKSDDLIIVVNDTPVPEPAVNVSAASVGEILEFNAEDSFDPDGEIIEYIWDFGDSSTGTGVKTGHGFEKPGTYTINLKVKDNSGTNSDSAQKSIEVFINDPPVAKAGEDQMVTISEVRFNGNQSTDSDGNLIAYEWDFGDKEKASGSEPVHYYKNPGTYTVTLTITDDSKTSTSRTSDTLIVTVNEKPIADAGPDRIGMPGEKLLFDGRSSFDPDGEIAQYFWDFGDNTDSRDPAPVHAFEKPGIYTLKLKVKDNSGHEEAVGFAQAVVTINVQPAARAGRDIIAAPAQKIEFDSTGSYDPDGNITLYQWRFSDELFPADTAKTVRSFSEPGIYTANLVITDNSGAANSQSSDSVLIKINNRPIAIPGKNIHTCDQTVLFDGTASPDPDGDPLSYTWDFGDGSPEQNGPQLMHTYEKGGSYPVTLTVDDRKGLENSTHTASLRVKINQRPTAIAGTNRTGCAGEVILFNGGDSFDPEGGPLNYLWDFGDGTKDQGVNPTKTYKKGGIYPVSLTVEDDSGLACNTSQDHFYIHVVEAPISDAGPDMTVCANTLVQFDGSNSRDFDGVVNNFSWDFGDGSAGGGKILGHVFELPGTYRVVLTITGDKIGDCNNVHKDEALIKVIEAPFASFTIPEMIPEGEEIIFDSSNSKVSKHGIHDKSIKIISQTWDFGDNNNQAGEKVSHVYEKFGKYFVTLTISTDSENECNTSSLRKPVIVNAKPIVAAGEDREAAINQELVFNASQSSDPDGSITSCNWDFGDGESKTGIEVKHSYKKAGNYKVVLTIKDNTEMSNNWVSDTIAVRVNEPPKPLIEMDKPSYCLEQEINFDGTGSTDADGSIISWHWDFGDGNKAEGDKVSHAYKKYGTYSLVLTIDDGSPVINSKSRLIKNIIINRPPNAQAGPDRMVCPGQKVMFDASSSFDHDGEIIKYEWDFGDKTIAQGSKIEHVYDEPGEYKVVLKVTDNSGSVCNTGEDTAAVYVNAPPKADAGQDRKIFTGAAHDAVLFDAAQSSDPDNDPLTYIWDFGDKTKQKGPQVFHFFTKPGKYKVRLNVRDGSGLSCGEAWDEAEIIVEKR